jgi:D-arabinose 1-dehydrogenase-like Zn-dependent alcohol dehydrogenase
MSYNLQDRFTPGDGPVCIVTEEMSPAWAAAHPEAVLAQPNLEGLAEDQTFDDILVPDPTPEVVQAMAERLNPGGVMMLFGNPARHGKVSLDIGRIHYKNVRLFGGGTNVEEIRKANAREDLLPQGTSIFIGAGGPMGQMHVQRAIEIPCGSRTVVVTDLDRERLDHIEARFGEMARAKGIALHLLAPSDFGGNQDAMNDRIRELAPSGYNDVCLLAPVAKLVTFAVGLAADNGLVNVFAGLPVGSYADVELNDLCRGVKIFGSSGSRISDLRKILHMVEEGELNTNLSVAAIGGLNAAREGLEGVNAGRFPGKTVIYTQIPDLPLMSLEDIRANVPEVADKLGPAGEWTKEAEAALFEWHLARQG